MFCSIISVVGNPTPGIIGSFLVEKKPHMTYNEKRLTNSLERVHMEQLKNTTDLLGLEDKNIKILSVLKYQTHLVVQAKLDSPLLLVLIVKGR